MGTAAGQSAPGTPPGPWPLGDPPDDENVQVGTPQAEPERLAFTGRQPAPAAPGAEEMQNLRQPAAKAWIGVDQTAENPLALPRIPGWAST
jgi:hypothetical protein